MYCPYCNKDTDTTVREIQETYPVKGEDITVNAHVRVCNCCKNDIWDTELDTKNLMDAYDEYRKRHQLLSPEDIRAIRNKYKLSQTAFARVLGLGDKTITRYENGSVADAAPNNLIFLAQQPSNFKQLLEKNRSSISDTEYKVAQEALEDLHACVITTGRKTLYSGTEKASIRYSNKPDFYWGDNYA